MNSICWTYFLLSLIMVTSLQMNMQIMCLNQNMILKLITFSTHQLKLSFSQPVMLIKLKSLCSPMNKKGMLWDSISRYHSIRLVSTAERRGSIRIWRMIQPLSNTIETLCFCFKVDFRNHLHHQLHLMPDFGLDDLFMLGIK